MASSAEPPKFDYANSSFPGFSPDVWTHRQNHIVLLRQFLQLFEIDNGRDGLGPKVNIGTEAALTIRVPDARNRDNFIEFVQRVRQCLERVEKGMYFRHDGRVEQILGSAPAPSTPIHRATQYWDLQQVSNRQGACIYTLTSCTFLKLYRLEIGRPGGETFGEVARSVADISLR